MVPFPCWSSRVLNVRPAANINETDAYAPFRRTFYAVSDGQGPPGRSSADWLQKPASSAAPTDTALRLFQSRPCYLSPTEQQRISRAPPLQPRRGPMLFRQRPRAPQRRPVHGSVNKQINAAAPFRCAFHAVSAAVKAISRKKPDGNRFADSARQCRRFKSGRAAIPPPTPPNDGTKKDRTSTAARSCIGFLWLALRSPRPAGDGGLRPLSGSGNPKAAKRRSLAALLFRSPASKGAAR